MKSTKDPVYRISGARKGLTEDVAGRQRRYVVSMSIRTVCFVAAVFTPSPWRWVLVAGALFLPYIAVVIANAGREPTSNAPVEAQIVPPVAPRAIEPPAGAVLTGAERDTVRTRAEDSWTQWPEGSAPRASEAASRQMWAPREPFAPPYTDTGSEPAPKTRSHPGGDTADPAAGTPDRPVDPAVESAGK